jgi:hypothetical protein
MKKLLTLILILLAAPCFGELAHYKCTIKNFYTVNEKDGLLVETKAGLWKSDEFFVDRQTGNIVGDWIPNAAAHTIKVVDYGDDENAFEVVSFFNVNNSKNAESLTVYEYSDSKLKPFHASNGNGVFTGLCE